MNRLVLSQQSVLRDLDDGHPLSPCGILGAKARRMTEQYLIETFDETLSEMIEGSVRAKRSRIVALIQGRVTMDRITAELCAEACCDPAFATAIAVALRMPALVECAATEDLILNLDNDAPSSSDACDTAVWVAPDVRWMGNGSISIDRLLEAVAIGAVGRRLRDLISHPVLDRYDLKVIGAGATATGTPLLWTDADRVTLTEEEILSIRTPMARTKR